MLLIKLNRALSNIKRPDTEGITRYNGKVRLSIDAATGDLYVETAAGPVLTHKYHKPDTQEVLQRGLILNEWVGLPPVEHFDGIVASKLKTFCKNWIPTDLKLVVTGCRLNMVNLDDTVLHADTTDPAYITDDYEVFTVVLDANKVTAAVLIDGEPLVLARSNNYYGEFLVESGMHFNNNEELEGFLTRLNSLVETPPKEETGMLLMKLDALVDLPYTDFTKDIARFGDKVTASIDLESERLFVETRSAPLLLCNLDSGRPLAAGIDLKAINRAPLCPDTINYLKDTYLPTDIKLLVIIPRRVRLDYRKLEVRFDPLNLNKTITDYEVYSVVTNREKTVYAVLVDSEVVPIAIDNQRGGFDLKERVKFSVPREAELFISTLNEHRGNCVTLQTPAKEESVDLLPMWVLEEQDTPFSVKRTLVILPPTARMRNAYNAHQVSFFIDSRTLGINVDGVDLEIAELGPIDDTLSNYPVTPINQNDYRVELPDTINFSWIVYAKMILKLGEIGEYLTIEVCNATEFNWLITKLLKTATVFGNGMGCSLNNINGEHAVEFTLPGIFEKIFFNYNEPRGFVCDTTGLECNRVDEDSACSYSFANGDHTLFATIVSMLLSKD